MSEIEGIHYPFSSIQKIANSSDVSDILENIVTVEEIMALKASKPIAENMLADIKSGRFIIPSINSLKEYRAAMIIRKKYESKGIGYVLFAHEKGLNIDNPRTYDRTAGPKEKVEDVLKRKIAAEIKSSVKKYISETTKRNGSQ